MLGPSKRFLVAPATSLSTKHAGATLLVKNGLPFFRSVVHFRAFRPPQASKPRSSLSPRYRPSSKIRCQERPPFTSLATPGDSIKAVPSYAAEFQVTLFGDFNCLNCKGGFNSQSYCSNTAGKEVDSFEGDDESVHACLPSSSKFFRYYEGRLFEFIHLRWSF